MKINLLLVNIFSILLFFLLVGLNAQEIAISREEQTQLDKEIHFNASRYTLLFVANELSKQTGLAIECAPYLRDRSFTFALEGINAKKILDSICELNNWKWVKIARKRFVLTKRTFIRPQSIIEVATTLRNVLPKDFSDFVGFGSIEESRFREKITNLPELDNAQFASQIKSHLLKICEKEGRKLFESVLNEYPKSSSVTFKNLSVVEQNKLTMIMTLKTLMKSNIRAIRGDLKPYEINPLSAELRIDNGFLDIGVQPQNANSGFLGFGVQLTTPK